MNKAKFKRIDENNEVEYFGSLMEAARSIDTKVEDWKVATAIASAILYKHRAYKYRWEQIG